MRYLAAALVIIIVLSAGAIVFNMPQRNETQVSRGITYWSGTVSVHIKYFKCDPGLDTFGDPDPYFVVFINEQEFKSPTWDDDEFVVNWWANATITTRDKVVWIEISAWDDDSGLYGRDDLIDLDPGYGYSLDLIYNLETHSWAGDVTGNNASGNRDHDWGMIWFEITSTPDLEDSGDMSINVPYDGYGRLDSSHIIVNGNDRGQFMDGSDTYLFYLYNGDSVDIYMEPSPFGNFAIYLYNSDILVASSASAGYGGMEHIHYTANTPGQYKLIVSTEGGYGEYHLSIGSGVKRVVNAGDLGLNLSRAYLLNRDWSNINVRMMGYHVEIGIYNPTSVSGYVRINILNLDPDFMETSLENSTYRGKYSLTIILQINASESKVITLWPWHEPADDFWIFAMGDNRPGCGILDNPIDPSPEYTLFTHYYTHIIRTPIGWDDGDLVAGFGGGLVAHYDSVPESSLDYVYDMEYNRFYMLTGLSDNFFFTTVGNHDVTRYQEHPQHEGEKIYQEYLGNLYYSFNFSNTHFVFPDDYQDGYWSDGTPWWYSYGEQRYGGYIYGQQLQWLENDLKLANNSGYTHKIVVMHMPLIVPPERDENLNDEFINYTNRVDVAKIFKKYGVDYLVVAHIHNYTPYYTNLEYVNGTLNVTSSSSPEGEYSVFTLLTGGAGAHNNYEWIVPDIEGSYHFALIHVNRSEIHYYIYKYENLTDSDGNPLTSITYRGPNDGSEVSQEGVINNQAIYRFPYIRMKFYMSNEYDDYVAYSETYGTFEKVYLHKFKDYTVVYVETSAPANGENVIKVYSPNGVPEFGALTVPLMILVVFFIAVTLRRR